MISLEESIKEIEIYYKQQKSRLFKEKFSLFCLSVIALIYSHVRILYHAYLHGIAISNSLIVTADIVAGVIVFSSFVFSPLYKFISDKIFLKMNWDIKTSIFKTVLNIYTRDYHFSFQGELPDEDISNLEFEKGLFDFCSEKDFIFGKINSRIFRISVVNKVSVFSKRFNGIVAVIVLEKPITEMQQPLINTIVSKHKSIKLLKIIKNKIYIGYEGKKKYFEFEIIKGKVNKQDLMDDFAVFKTIVETLNELSKSPVEISIPLHPI